MAIARSSCYIVNLSPPRPKQKPAHLKPCNYFQSKTTVQAQQTRWKIKKDDVQEEESWKRRSQLNVGATMAIIIGLEIGGLNIIDHQYYNNSSGTSNSTSSNYGVNIGLVHEEYVHHQKKIAELTKWSDKRTCPQWKLNSLETIVPENLPRPSSAHRRRWEAVAYSNYKTNAPSVKTSTNCFAL